LKIGLKLWSTNRHYIRQALDLYNQGRFSYIELFVEPHSEDFLNEWKSLRIPFVLHAPTSYTGLNFSDSRFFETNVSLVSAVAMYSCVLNPNYVIFHPGILGTIEETIRQINSMKRRFPQVFNVGLIENKPKVGLKDERCIGYAPPQIKRLMNDTGMGFCLDFGHAICAAAAERCFWKEYIDSFIELYPQLFHLSDGHVSSVKDEHLHLKEGDFDIPWIVSRIPEDGMVSLETRKDSLKDLNDFRNDIDKLVS
jgi:deoxyribonuclease IV